MYIAPNSTVQLMTNIPLDPSYNHTLYWLSAAQMETYMSSHVLKTYQAQSYVHKNRGVLRLEGDMGVYAEVNYMRFKNTSFENKWFYAFVTDINYVNNEVFEVTFQIDVMQTWFFEYKGKLNQCMVEREHSASDNVGDNIVEENLELGPYVCSGMERFLDGDTSSGVLIIASQSPEGNQNSNFTDGVYSGLYTKYCKNATELEDALSDIKSGVTGSLETIIAINQFPRKFVQWGAGHTPVDIYYTLKLDQTIGLGGFRCLDPVTQAETVYVPRNNKLYTYPYNYMLFESPDGSNLPLRYELFKTYNGHAFTMKMVAFPVVEVMAYPQNYEVDMTRTVGEGDVYPAVGKYALFAKQYPTGGIASDAFSAWWAQNKSGIEMGQLVSVMESGAGGISGMLGGAGLQNEQLGAHISGADRQALGGGAHAGSTQTVGFNLFNAGLSALRGLFNMGTTQLAQDGMIAAKKMDHRAVPDTVVTKASGAGVMFYNGWYDFKIYYTQIHPDYAKRIDAYFDRYGYAVNEIKTPEIANRPVWNFIKTNGCTLNRTANVPAAFERDICACFDRGITFWKNAGQVGQYTADNSPQ